MPRPFVLPDLGEGLQEAEIVKVLVAEGDVITEDSPLLEVETDKAQVEIPSPMSGRVQTIHVRPGQSVRVGEVLVTFADAGDHSRGGPDMAPTPPNARSVRGEAAAALENRRAGGNGRTTEAAEARAILNVDPRGGPDLAPIPPDARSGRGEAAAALGTGPVPATPATRRLARELGIDIRIVRGSGPAGRVTNDDVRSAAGVAQRGARPEGAAPAQETAERPRGRRVDEEVPTGVGHTAEPPAPAKPLAPIGIEAPPLPNFEQWGPIERQPLSHLRRTIAERMALSARLIPHVTHFDKADIADLDALVRRNLDRGRERGVTLTLTSFILKATALSLREHPAFNATLDAAAGQMIVKRYYHLGIAVASERGLIVPVIRDVDRKPVVEIARELAALAARVREGKATLDDLKGGTFTVTNIGALGGTGAIPIINYPEVAILGVSRGREEAVVRDGQIVPRMRLPISLTFDHRVADGADGARFASAIVRRLEHPDELLLEL
ncbi:MAG: 2-oxo acid dehydrogenase subunit E2 [Candidatus Rokubacteria bacterium]|nr:2-oxo acid dehydrogenase subunit E2 [Candidatus Rokubacteria bacterium]